MPNPIQAVIFDQDGLMFDTESLAATSWFLSLIHISEPTRPY